MPKDSPIGFQMAEKNANRHTDTQTDSYRHTDTQTHIFVFIYVEIPSSMVICIHKLYKVKTKQNKSIRLCSVRFTVS